MPESRNRNTPTQSIRQIQNTRHGAAGAAGDKTEITQVLPACDQIDTSDLTFRQQAALPVIAAAPSLSRAAFAAGIDEKTLRRWLREPLFADRLAAFRRQSAIIAREELNALARRGMAVFAEAMSDPNPAIRVRAARYALSYTVQFSELQNLGAGLEEVKQLLLTESKPEENAGK